MASNTQEMNAADEQVAANEETATTGATESGMDGNVAGALSYLFTILTGIVFYVIDDREFVRFHAAQSMAFGGLLFVGFIALTILQFVFGTVLASGSTGGFILGTLVSLGLLVVWLVVLAGAFAAWVYMMYKAYSGKTPRMPIAAGIADKLV